MPEQVWKNKRWQGSEWRRGRCSVTLWGCTLSQHGWLWFPEWCAFVWTCLCVKVWVIYLNSVTQLSLPTSLLCSSVIMCQRRLWLTSVDERRVSEAATFSELSIWTHSSPSRLFVSWKDSSHSHPLLSLSSPERWHSVDRLSLLWRLPGEQQAAGKWQRGDVLLMEIGGGLCWRPAGPHQPCTSPLCLPLEVKADVARPSSGDRWSFWRRATAQCSLLVGLRWSSQEWTWSPSVGNIQEL